MTPQQMNHPKAGDCIAVDPIRKLQDVAEIKDYLKDKPRDLALFITGINTSLRASDLVRLTVGQFRGLKVGDHLLLKVKKTQRNHLVTMNRAVLETVAPLLEAADDQPVFRSAKTGGALTVPAVHKLVKSWCRDCGLRGNFGSHSLRKTWAFHQLSTFKASEEVISEALGHASVRVTRRYLGIQSEDVQTLYMNEI
jgi:integrase